jgi:hypothetical protein
MFWHYRELPLAKFFGRVMSKVDFSVFSEKLKVGQKHKIKLAKCPYINSRVVNNLEHFLFQNKKNQFPDYITALFLKIKPILR